MGSLRAIFALIRRMVVCPLLAACLCACIESSSETISEVSTSPILVRVEVTLPEAATSELLVVPVAGGAYLTSNFVETYPSEPCEATFYNLDGLVITSGTITTGIAEFDMRDASLMETKTSEESDETSQFCVATSVICGTRELQGIDCAALGATDRKIKQTINAYSTLAALESLYQVSGGTVPTLDQGTNGAYADTDFGKLTATYDALFLVANAAKQNLQGELGQVSEAFIGFLADNPDYAALGYDSLAALYQDVRGNAIAPALYKKFRALGLDADGGDFAAFQDNAARLDAVSDRLFEIFIPAAETDDFDFHKQSYYTDTVNLMQTLLKYDEQTFLSDFDVSGMLLIDALYLEYSTGDKTGFYPVPENFALAFHSFRPGLTEHPEIVFSVETGGFDADYMTMLGYASAAPKPFTCEDDTTCPDGYDALYRSWLEYGTSFFEVEDNPGHIDDTKFEKTALVIQAYQKTSGDFDPKAHLSSDIFTQLDESPEIDECFRRIAVGSASEGATPESCFSEAQSPVVEQAPLNTPVTSPPSSAPQNPPINPQNPPPPPPSGGGAVYTRIQLICGAGCNFDYEADKTSFQPTSMMSRVFFNSGGTCNGGSPPASTNVTVSNDGATTSPSHFTYTAAGNYFVVTGISNTVTSGNAYSCSATQGGQACASCIVQNPLP